MRSKDGKYTLEAKEGLKKHQREIRHTYKKIEKFSERLEIVGLYDE